MKFTVTCAVMVLLSLTVQADSLTAAEINQIESDLGIALSSNEIAQLSAVVYPSNMPQWRIDAYDRINTHRKAELNIQIVDMNGDPVEGAEIRIRQTKNDFKFGGVCTVMDLTDADNNLGREGSTTDDWKRITTNLFNAVGLNNGFKPKIANQHQYIPNFMSWANSNNLDVRGHLLIWPGGGDLDGGGNLSGTPGTDYGNHLSTANTSAYASYNVLGAVEDWATANPSQKAARLVDLHAEVDSEIAEWASTWDVYEWDVMNEVVGNTLLQQILGYDQMAEWFRIAETNKVSAETGLYINEFKIISADFNDGDAQYDSRSGTYMDRINTVIADGAPITGIGFQSRFKYGEIPMETVYNRLDEYATIYPDFTLAGTEFEIKDGQLVGGTNYVYSEQVRARMTEELLTTYFSHDQVIGLNVWDFMSATDDTADEVSAAMAWYDGTVKLNGLVWYYLHRIRFNTDATLASSLGGRTNLRAFKGDYAITISYDGQLYDASLTLTNNDTVVYQLGGVTAADPGTAEVVDAWHYDGLTNGAGLTEGVSTGIVGGVSFNNDALASIQNETVRWASDGSDPSVFQGKAPSSYAGTQTGRYQLSVDFLDADFTATADLTNGVGRVGFGIRSLTATDDASFRLVFNSGGGSSPEFKLEVTDDSVVNQQVESFSGSTLDHLAVRAVYDLDLGTYEVYYRLDGGTEVTAYAGTLPIGFALDELRTVVQTYNGGANWAEGDRIHTDNLVLRSLGEPPPPPTELVLERWTYGGVTNQAPLNDGLSLTGSGLAWPDKSPFGVVSNEMQRWEATGELNEGAFANISSASGSYTDATNGLYQLSFDVVYADFTSTDAAGGKAQFGYGIRDDSKSGGDRNGVLLVRYEDSGGENKFHVRLSAGSNVDQDIATGHTISNLHVRAVYDLENTGNPGSFTAYFSVDGGPETQVVSELAAGFVLQNLRMQFQALNGAQQWAPGDTVLVDNIELAELTPSAEETPASLYAGWLADYPSIGSQTNLTDNPDADLSENLLEYAFGGNPTNMLDIGVWPTFETMESGGTNYIEYVYVRRTDAETRGLDYQVQTVDDLISGTWTNAGYEVTGEGIYDAEYDVVTNRLPLTEDARFIRVRIEFTP